MDAPSPTMTPAVSPQIAAAAAAFKGDPLQKSPEQIAAEQQAAADAQRRADAAAAAEYAIQRRSCEVRNQVRENRMRYASEIAPWAMLALVVGVWWGSRGSRK